MADPNEAPSPAALRHLANPTDVAYSHGEWIERVKDALRACATALEAKDRVYELALEDLYKVGRQRDDALTRLEAKDREIARLDPMRSLKCPHGWLSWECSECIRARGKEPKP